VTVLIDTSAIRLVALRLFPSTSALTIWTRFAVLSRFMSHIMRERSRRVKQKMLDHNTFALVQRLISVVVLCRIARRGKRAYPGPTREARHPLRQKEGSPMKA
jgi:hypothetical protein